MFSNKERGDINTFVCAISLYVAETPKASIKEPCTPITNNTFRHCRVRFCWTFLETAVDQTRKTVFDHISKHWEASRKYEA